MKHCKGSKWQGFGWLSSERQQVLPAVWTLVGGWWEAAGLGMYSAGAGSSDGSSSRSKLCMLLLHSGYVVLAAGMLTSDDRLRSL
jgi:hypothetical protein